MITGTCQEGSVWPVEPGKCLFNAWISGGKSSGLQHLLISVVKVILTMLLSSYPWGISEHHRVGKGYGQWPLGASASHFQCATVCLPVPHSHSQAQVRCAALTSQ